MFKRDPDDLISAASKNLKKEKPKVMRITLKRGGNHHSEIAKAHSRLARKALKQRVKQIALENQNEVWPLFVRYKQNTEKKKGEEQIIEQGVRLNTQVRPNKGNDFIRSLLGVFRVNFFKKKQEEGALAKKMPTKKNPESKRSHKKIAKNLRNRQRRQKRKHIIKQMKKDQQKREIQIKEEATNNQKIEK